MIRDSERRFRSTTALLTALLAVTGCKDIEGPGTPGASPGSAAPGRVVVDILDFAFVGPDGTDLITVVPGDTVVFVNRDVAPHTATATSWPGELGFDSGTLGKDETWAFVVPGEGEWVYRCDFHPTTMRGARIRAVAGGGSPADGPPLDGGAGGAGSGPGGGDSGDANGGGGGGASGSITIEMRNSRFFAPNGTDTVTIALGQRVSFVNADNSSHTATSSSGPGAFNSGRLREGQSYSWTPTQAGTWVYLCEYHPDTMSGAVIRVVDGGSAGAGSGGSGAGGGSGSVLPIRITASGYLGPAGTSEVTIALGQSVEWVNEDGVTHAVRSTDEPEDALEFDSGDIAPGSTFRFTPDRSGVWLYRCRYHGDERDLRVVVN